MFKELPSHDRSDKAREVIYEECNSLFIRYHLLPECSQSREGAST